MPVAPAAVGVRRNVLRSNLALSAFILGARVRSFPVGISARGSREALPSAETNDSAGKVLGEEILLRITREASRGGREERHNRANAAEKPRNPAVCTPQAHPAQVQPPARQAGESHAEGSRAGRHNVRGIGVELMAEGGNGSEPGAAS